jgi:Flp pilus assembly protein TadD
MQISERTAQRLRAFAEGKITWAQVEGMTTERARAIAQMGCELAAAGRLEEARTLFEGLVASNPKDASSQAALGTVYQKLGREGDALGAYSQAIAQDPKDTVALGNRGELRLRAGDKDGLADLVRAVEADPEGETAAGRRARGLVRALTLEVGAPRQGA